MLTGTIRDERGQVIKVAGAKFRVGADGVAEQSAEEVSYAPPVDANGNFQIKIVAGKFRVRATIEVSWNGGTYTFDLHPVQDNTVDQDGATGVVQDFVWKLTGPIPLYSQNPDPKNSTNWYGGAVTVYPLTYREDLKAPATPDEAGTKYSFKLVPTGTLIDGSPAKELTFERSFDGSRMDNQTLQDIPLAVYTLTGEEITPGGEKFPLVFGTAYAKVESAPVVDFPVDGIISGPFKAQLPFDR